MKTKSPAQIASGNRQTRPPFLRIAPQNTTGKGLAKNILDCCRSLVHNDEEGDALYFVGLTRGAYTVRSCDLSVCITPCRKRRKPSMATHR